MPKVVGVDEKHVKRISCRKCAAVVEYTEKDVRLLWSGTDYGGGSDGAKGFDCPGCGNQIHTERW